jgi:hypothetical protein
MTFTHAFTRPRSPRPAQFRGNRCVGAAPQQWAFYRLPFNGRIKDILIMAFLAVTVGYEP